MRKLDYEYDAKHHAFLAISKYCNLDCSYCYLPDGNKNQKIDVDQRAISMMEQFVQKARTERFALSRTHLHGAEPTTLTPEAFRYVTDLACSITTNDLISVQTNGIALNSSYHKQMGNLQDRLRIGFSLDLPESAHNKNRQNTFNKVVDNIAVARDLGYSHALLISVNRDTMDDLPAVVQSFDMLHQKFPAMNMTIKVTSGDLALSNEQKVEWADFLTDTGLHDYAMSVSGKVCQMHGNNCCLFEFHVDGGVTACNKSNNDEGVFANWMEEPMEQIFRKRRTLFQNHVISKSCFGCKYWEVCKGGCPVDRDGETGELLDCAIKKRIYANMERAGIDPVKETREIPRFLRQRAYRQWVKTGNQFQFFGEV